MNVTRYKCSVLAVDDDPATLAVLTGAAPERPRELAMELLSHRIAALGGSQ